MVGYFVGSPYLGYFHWHLLIFFIFECLRCLWSKFIESIKVGFSIFFEGFPKIRGWLDGFPKV